MENNNEILLKVEHLCQYFKSGKYVNRAVNDVSFDVKKGEVFGLVGESGCGKTTTGRSIIKLYDITSGNIYFKGYRIGAGVRSYQEEIARAQKKAKAEIKRLNKALASSPDKAQEIAKEMESVTAELSAIVSENRKKIREAKFDHKKIDKKYGLEQAAKVEAELLPAVLEQQKLVDGKKAEIDSIKAETKNAPEKVAEAEEKIAALKPSLDEENKKLKGLKKEYKEKYKAAKRTKLITDIQMIFQDPIASLDPRMTVREIISEGLVIRGIKDKKYIDEKVYEILELVGLVPEHAGRYPHEFSGGQRQRIGIARAVIMNPDMIIADEPISALDVSIQAQVINLLNDLREKLGLTILFIAHDLSVVKYFSDRIGVMYFGNMVEMASSEELFKNPLHPYTRSLLSAIPLPDPRYEKKRVRMAYNPIAEHDYSVDKPSMREIAPGHFVHCNDAEEEKYKALLR